jgi:hypothetical protein
VVPILLEHGQPCEGEYLSAGAARAEAGGTSTMSGKMKMPAAGACPFCGVATPVPHETQAGCIAALHSEIGRVRGILATLKPAGADLLAEAPDAAPASIRLSID